MKLTGHQDPEMPAKIDVRIYESGAKFLTVSSWKLHEQLTKCATLSPEDLEDQFW